ncbi:hypothetical protein CI102_2220 [Trichoderma harzianum]|nr:hypothetical protein CI102_2220 [Trichoderma harzianum]
MIACNQANTNNLCFIALYYAKDASHGVSYVLVLIYTPGLIGGFSFLFFLYLTTVTTYLLSMCFALGSHKALLTCTACC